ncbi:MAG: hypothetical protein LBG75_03445 [Candidatus Nomurabacteria bacterium]|jgi:NAD(P)H-hydrate repair Nnr-like enzyme with NAD(P)H-hydrate dehydratase domain|nr:hypothetical protein [Candidatus Nomurabacteria bacterium]
MDYWQKQDDKPLFADIVWNKPEQKTHAGKLAIVGGNKLSFAAVARSFAFAEGFGAGQVKALVPDALKPVLPHGAGIVFAPSNHSGGLGREAQHTLDAVNDWANVTVLIGDLGKNSETEILIENFVARQPGRLVITRDSVDLLAHNTNALLERDNTVLIATFAQLQKLFKNAYYNKIITFSMTLSTLVETLHKFTITYPVTVATVHQDTAVVAHSGQVTTTPLSKTGYSPLTIWSGEAAIKAALYFLWNPSKSLEAVTTSLL